MAQRHRAVAEAGAEQADAAQDQAADAVSGRHPGNRAGLPIARDRAESLSRDLEALRALRRASRPLRAREVGEACGMADRPGVWAIWRLRKLLACGAVVYADTEKGRMYAAAAAGGADETAAGGADETSASQ